MPIKVLQTLILKAQDTRESSTDSNEKAYEQILGVDGKGSALTAIPILQISEASPSPGSTALDNQINPLVYLLPAAKKLPLHPYTERCVQLLLLMIFNQLKPEGVDKRNERGRAIVQNSGGENKIRSMFCSMVDEKDDEEVIKLDSHKPCDDSFQVFVDFRVLTLHLATHIVESETLCLLVYSLLQYNTTFFDNLMASKGI